ncbi:MAG: undecaprenyl-diphosphate phosphatase [Pseudomonadota bacterium]|jgi:undecaprenyl-diphosphatase|nr:undecaprenyl-diphosphate phosphatase [Alphaproteobacteria bacterium]
MAKDLIFLSLFQGIAEFLPISSSAHLIVLEKLFGSSTASFEMHVALHFGSLLALFIYFIKDICSMIFGICMSDIKGLKKHPSKKYRDSAWILVLSSIPALAVGFGIKKIYGATSESLYVMGIASIVFGVLLIISDSNPVKDRLVTYKRGIFVGIMQCFAFIPGASRSGVCLTAARFLGLNRVEATRFTFLMAIPTILGASTLVLLDSANVKELFSVAQLILIGMTAGLGIITIQILLWFLGRFSFFYFGIYRIIFGALVLWFF